MRNSLFILATLTSFLVTGCGSLGVKTARVNDLSHRHYATFNFKTPGRQFDPEIFSPENQQRVQQAIRSELTQHGLRESSQPDLLVGFYLRIRSKQFDLDHPTAEGDSLADIMNSYYGFVTGAGKSLNQQKTIRYREGTLVVYLVDAKTNEIVWQGIAKGAIHPKDSEDKIEHRIKEAAESLFKKFPGFDRAN
jgi:hypothetical protein